MTKTEWNKSADHPLQTWEWGEFRKAMGVTIDRLIIEDTDRTTYLQIGYHRIPRLPLTVGYAPRGPELSLPLIEMVKKNARMHRAIFVQLEPNIQRKDFRLITDPQLKPAAKELFTRYTFVLDISKSEAEILAELHPKTRYNLKLALKKGVTVREDNSDRAFSRYLELSDETTRRQGFFAHNETYHRIMWKHLSPPGIARLFTACYESKIIAAWIIFVWKDTVYYPYGASSREYKNVMAPNLLLWEIARWAKARKLKKFDLWGALGPNPDPDDPWYGFHKFKEGYRPELVEFAGSFDLVTRPFSYRLFTAANSLRWWYLKLKRQGFH